MPDKNSAISTEIALQILRYKDGLLPNALALSWVTLAYITGLAFCLNTSLWYNLAGTLLLAHSMVIAAYLVHECAHNTIFASSNANRFLGEALNFVNGAIYSPFEQIRYKHMRHHVDRADVVAVDYRAWLSSRSTVLINKLYLAERLGIPVVELAMRTLAIVTPFQNQRFGSMRPRVMVCIVARIGALLVLAWISPRILALYPLAYILSLHVLRYMDAHQHTFPIREDLYVENTEKGPKPGLDRAFEERNTFSNPISERWPVLNLLVLNFCYHNAHHRKPTQPWHRLPKQHKEIYGDDNEQVLKPAEVRYSYTHYGRDRLLNEDQPDIGIKRGNAANFIGVDGVSFLVPF